MALSQEQIEQLKEQILEQLVNFPEDKRQEIKDRILSMSPEEFEEFLRQNQMLEEGDENTNETGEKTSNCIFCSIAQEKIKSYKIDENKENIAILELNPISRGHVLIVPKEHTKEKDLQKSSLELAQKVALKIKNTLKPKDIKITPTSIMGHAILQVIPFYENTDITKKTKASEKELLDLQDILTKIPEVKAPEKPVEKPKIEEKPVKKELPKMRPRIP